MCCTQQLSLKYARAMSLGLLIISHIMGATKEKGNSYTSSEVFHRALNQSFIPGKNKGRGGGGGGEGSQIV